VPKQQEKPRLCRKIRAFGPVTYLDLAGILQAMCQYFPVAAKKKRRAFRPVDHMDLVGMLQAMYQVQKIRAFRPATCLELASTLQANKLRIQTVW